MSLREFDQLCQQAKQCIAKRDWAGARQTYEKAIGIKSDVPDVHQGLATICFQMRDYRTAAHHFREVTQLDPLRAGAFINLGAVLNLLGELEDAVSALRRGIQLDPKRAEGFYNLGLVYRRQGQNKLAIEAYREAVRLSPKMADAHYNLGNIYLEREDYAKAIRAYREALQARPTWEKALSGLTQAEEAQEREAAEEAGLGDDTAQSAGASMTMRFGVDIDPVRMVDPEKHGELLEALHNAILESQGRGVRLLEVVEDQIEPLVKELSACLLYSGRSASLGECLKKFEEAIGQMKELHDKLRDGVFKTQTVGWKLARS